MTTGQLIILDHVVTLLSAAAWLGAGAAAAARRSKVSLGLLVTAVVATLGRAASVAVLADRGWWFVQEKVVLGLPILAVAGLVAAVLVGRRLVVAIQSSEMAALPFGTVVALLTAGYAAFAGFAVTFLVGYPLTWSSALITVSLISAAALLTWRVLATPATPPSPPEVAALTRRRFIGMAGGTVAAATGVTGVGIAFASESSVDAGGGPELSSRRDQAVSVTALRGPDSPAAGGRVQRQTLTARTATVQLTSGHEVDAWTYNGELPGPAITATEGDLIEVTLRNADIDDGVTLHWHGYDIPCGDDGAPGVTQDAVMPGQEFVYRFRADQVGTYWYHTHQVSHRGVRLGLYGALVVTPRENPPGSPDDVDLTLPVHTFSGTTVIGGSDEILEHSAKPGTRARLRLINTDSDPRRFALAGTTFRLAAVDGRDLNEPGELSRVGLRLPAGGRYDLIFVMPGNPVALVVDNDHDGGVRIYPGNAANAADVGEDIAAWPELDLLDYGMPTSVQFDGDSQFDRHFTLVLDRGVAMVDGTPTYAHTVNGRGHPSIPEQLVAEGDLVRFTVVNRSLETHPWHLHGHPVLVLSSDGQPSSGSPLWVDTFDVRPGEVWEVAFRADNPGLWMNHCHNLPHAEQGMMLQLSYAGVTTPFHGVHADGGSGWPEGKSHGH
jgi:FtsP/CotA-like multicopper oxidase with cupredoxin domain